LTRPELTPTIADEAPTGDTLTDYDQRHLVVYLRLLDAGAEGLSEAEMANIVLGIDAAMEPERARKVLASHLLRVRWITESRHRHLLGR
jgi:hypothetical protein